VTHRPGNLIEGMRELGEHLDGELTITLLEAVDRGVEAHEMQAARVLDSIAWPTQRDQSA